MSTNLETIAIKTEQDAFDLLEKLVDGFKLNDVYEVHFEAWPRFVIRIQGDDFDGTIPTRIMPTLLELQKEVHKLYCHTHYGDDNTRRLTQQERESLELLVKVDKGSSIYETFLSDPIVKIFQGAITKMTPEQITAVLIVFGLSVTSVLFWKMFLANRIKEKELDHTIELSKIEMQKMELIANAAKQFPETRQATQGMDGVRNDLLMKMKPSDNLHVDTSTTDNKYPTPLSVNGVFAEEVTHKQRETSVEKIIDDQFLLKSADFSQQTTVRVELEQRSNHYSFRADIPIGVLNFEQMNELKNNSWDKKDISMRILVKEINQRYTTAKVVSIITEALN